MMTRMTFFSWDGLIAAILCKICRQAFDRVVAPRFSSSQKKLTYVLSSQLSIKTIIHPKPNKLLRSSSLLNFFLF